jgi:hypothetical protein
MVTLSHRSLRGLASVVPTTSAFKIPVVDFSKFKSDARQKERQQTAEEIVAAFKESGFIYLRNHGISPSMSTASNCTVPVELTPITLVTIQNTFQKVRPSIYDAYNYNNLSPER